MTCLLVTLLSLVSGLHCIALRLSSLVHAPYDIMPCPSKCEDSKGFLPGNKVDNLGTTRLVDAAKMANERKIVLLSSIHPHEQYRPSSRTNGSGARINPRESLSPTPAGRSSTGRSWP